MNTQPIFDTALHLAQTTYSYGKTIIEWSGHKINGAMTQYAIPVAKRLYDLALVAFKALGQIVRNGPSFVFALSAGLFLAGVTAFRIADRKAYEEDPVARSLWKTAGIAAFLAATTTTAFGIGAVLV